MWGPNEEVEVCYLVRRRFVVKRCWVMWHTWDLNGKMKLFDYTLCSYWYNTKDNIAYGYNILKTT
jgi:hypothetical protein